MNANRTVLSMLGCVLLAFGGSGCGVGLVNSSATSVPITDWPPATPPPEVTAVLVADGTVVSSPPTSAGPPATTITAETSSLGAIAPATTIAADLSALDISDQYGDAVVHIVAEGCGLSGSGSGFAIDSSRVVTAAHVVDNTNHPAIRLRSGALVLGTVIGRDETWDVAVIQTPENSFAATAAWGDVGSVREGAALTVIGYPKSPISQADGAYDVLPVTVRSVISGGAIFEVSAGPDHGNSGGPAFDAKGGVVGLLLAGGTTGTANYAYVISSIVAAPLVDSMIAAPGAPEPACTVATAPPVAAPQGPTNPVVRQGEEYRGTWLAQVASLPIDVDIGEAKREYARFLALDPGFVPVLSAEWPATFDRADRIILIRGGFGSRAEAESACASWGLAVPGDCLARLLQ